MAKISKHRVRGIAILIVFLALLLAGWMAMKQTNGRENFDYRDSSKQFANAGSLSKAEYTVTATDVAKALDEMNNVVNVYSIAQPLRRERLQNYGKYIFAVSRVRLPELAQRLAGLGTIIKQSEIVDTSLVYKNLGTEEAILLNRRNELARLEADTGKVSATSEAKRELIDSIRDLEKNIDILRNNESTLVHVKMQPAVGGDGLSVWKNFARYFLLSLAGLFALAIVLYFGTRLIMWLLTLFGFKGFNLGNVGGDQYGSYANKYYTSRYGYKGSKRKVKRIYKDKPSTPRDDDSDL